jgi:hypothetical protein
MVLIIRQALLQEDEGLARVVKECPHKEAVEWIAAQAGQYFRPECYFIALPLDDNQAAAHGFCPTGVVRGAK